MRRLSILFLSSALLVNAQMGKECIDDAGCDKYQSCSFGYCKCDEGFLKIDKSCYKDEVKHGEICEFDVQCSNDHRLTCLEVKDGEKRCQCCKHYVFDEELEECVHAKNLTEMLSLLTEQWDNSGKIEAEAKKIFKGVVAAGLLSVVLGVTIAGGCIIYVCCIPQWKMMVLQLEQDNQTMPLCPVPKEPMEVTSQEPSSPIGQSTNPWEDTSNELNPNLPSTAAMIV